MVDEFTITDVDGDRLHVSGPTRKGGRTLVEIVRGDRGESLAVAITARQTADLRDQLTMIVGPSLAGEPPDPMAWAVVFTEPKRPTAICMSLEVAEVTASGAEGRTRIIPLIPVQAEP